jgi:hypothetical protein
MYVLCDIIICDVINVTGGASGSGAGVDCNKISVNLETGSYRENWKNASYFNLLHPYYKGYINTQFT